MGKIQRKVRRDISRLMIGKDSQKVLEVAEAVGKRASAEDLKIAFNKGVEEATKASKSLIEERISNAVKEGFAQGRGFATGEMLVMILTFLHFERGYGKKRLSDFLHDFNEFGDIVQEADTTIEGYKEILKDECGFDVVAEFKKAEEETGSRRKLVRKNVEAYRQMERQRSAV